MSRICTTKNCLNASGNDEWAFTIKIGLIVDASVVAIHCALQGWVSWLSFLSYCFFIAILLLK